MPPAKRKKALENYSKKEPECTSELPAAPSLSSKPTLTAFDDPNLCSAFEVFPKLPAEMRLRVWHFARPGPRIVTVNAQVLTTHVARAIKGVKFTSTTPVPAVLHTCRESRAEALKTYTLGLKTYCCSGRFYVDHTRDTIYLNSVAKGSHWDLGSLAWGMSEKERRKIQHLAVEQGLFDHDREENTEILFDLRGLKTITLVMEKDQEAKSELAAFHEPREGDSTLIHWSTVDDEEEDLWPQETKWWMELTLQEVEDNHKCGVEMPRVEFKVLTTAN